MEHNMTPPGHAEHEGPGPLPRCPHCATVIDTYLAAGAGIKVRNGVAQEMGRCPEHGLVPVSYGDREAIKREWREMENAHERMTGQHVCD